MTLGIIAAMESEAEQIKAAMTSREDRIISGITYTNGLIGKTNVVCAVCGIGKVFAAVCTQTMILTCHPDFVVNTGVGGTLTPELSVGDVALAEAVVQHDMDTSPLGDPVGLISGLNLIYIQADPKLTEKIRLLAEENGVRTKLGNIVSGDQFIADRAKKDSLVRSFAGIVCEMEGGAVGQVCAVNNVPFAVVRAISDSADGSAHEEYPTFMKKSAEKSAKIIVSLADSLE